MPLFRTFKGKVTEILLLEKYPNASMAFSLRKLNNYDGACIRVRRSSDNTEQDIGFISSGELNTAALLTFVSSGDGFISKWYNQSGRSYNLEQQTLSRQPKIVNAGVVITRNNKSSLYFENNALNCILNTGELVSSLAESSMFFCFQAPPNTNTLAGTDYESSVIGIYPWVDGNTYYEVGNTVQGQGGITAPVSWNNFAIGSFLKSVGNTFVFQNNINKATSGGNVASFTSTSSIFSLGSSPNGGGGNFLRGYISEFIAYNSFLQNHESLVTDLNFYYQIY